MNNQLTDLSRPEYAPIQHAVNCSHFFYRTLMSDAALLPELMTNMHQAFAIDEMNKAQSQYNFIFENKPGAGSAIAARHVENNPSNTVLTSLRESVTH